MTESKRCMFVGTLFHRASMSCGGPSVITEDAPVPVSSAQQSIAIFSNS
eukprot:CAMPEP_0172843536 /NCGR_PEP_ID=MMETSP1075-20121228/31545_1 /TAXON_ID=2916 /ORGANISM="Ceratium fusus, Strain PA161109" /LENGTH=48 /DNA_ID= /DNA_START= /DNA_END= /DNA_ORIENTATION=